MCVLDIVRRMIRGVNEPGWLANCSSSARSKLGSGGLDSSSRSARDLSEPNLSLVEFGSKVRKHVRKMF